MGRKVFESERDTQIVIDKKIDIRKGDKVEVKYLVDKDGEKTAANVYINDKKIIKLDLEELEQFLTLFLTEPI